jgi:hypothetical protein
LLSARYKETLLWEAGFMPLLRPAKAFPGVPIELTRELHNTRRIEESETALLLLATVAAQQGFPELTLA